MMRPLVAAALAAAACSSNQAQTATVDWTVTPVVGSATACGIDFVGDDVIVAADVASGPIDLGGGELSPGLPGPMTVLARFGPQGDHKWSVAFSPHCVGLAVADDGTVLLARQDDNAVSITALDGDTGMFAFQNYLPPSSGVIAHDVALSPNGEIVVVGSFMGDWMGNVIQLHADDGYDAFVVFLGPAGEERRGYSFNGGPMDEARSVAVAIDNKVAVSGVGAAADLVSGGTPGGTDRFLALFDRFGTKLYALSFPADDTTAHGVGIDGDGVLSFDGVDMLRVDAQGMPDWTYPVDGPVDVAGSEAGVVLAEEGRVSKLTLDGARIWFADVEGMLTVAAIAPNGRVAVGGTNPLFVSFAP
jgi:hypothetical protein